jgi:hypothetical protein
MQLRGIRRELSDWKRLARMVLSRDDLNLKNLYAGTVWAVLEKITNE